MQVSQAAAPLAIDCTISVRLTGLAVAKGGAYRTEIDANTVTTAPTRWS